MSYKTGILLGRISKVKGYDGIVTVRLERSFIEKIPELNTVFLEIEGKPVPFFIAWSDYPGGDIIRMRFAGYESSDALNDFTACRVFLDKGEGKELPNSGIGDITGYTAASKDKRLSGTIVEIIDNPGQLLLKVNTGKGKELLIPFHEDLIISADPLKRLIIMDLPEGLAEIN